MVKDKKLRRLVLRIVEQIKEGYEPERIILYGSYACGRPTRDSDIDLFIVKETDKRRTDRFVEVKRLIKGYLLTQGWKLQKTHDLEVLEGGEHVE
jgi:predicted nucleotidyltransferase